MPRQLDRQLDQNLVCYTCLHISAEASAITSGIYDIQGCYLPLQPRPQPSSGTGHRLAASPTGSFCRNSVKAGVLCVYHHSPRTRTAGARSSLQGAAHEERSGCPVSVGVYEQAGAGVGWAARTAALHNPPCPLQLRSTRPFKTIHLLHHLWGSSAVQPHSPLNQWAGGSPGGQGGRSDANTVGAGIQSTCGRVWVELVLACSILRCTHPKTRCPAPPAPGGERSLLLGCGLCAYRCSQHRSLEENRSSLQHGCGARHRAGWVRVGASGTQRTRRSLRQSVDQPPPSQLTARIVLLCQSCSTGRGEDNLVAAARLQESAA